MADTKLSALTALGGSPDVADLLYLDDVSAATSKSMTVTNLFTSPSIATPSTTGNISMAANTFINSNSNLLIGANSGTTIIRPNASSGEVQIQNFAGGTNNVRITDAGDVIILAPANTSTSATTNGATQTLTNKTLTSPTLTTPSLGVATATSINGNILTTGSSTYTGTAAATYTFPASTATIARTDAAQAFTGIQTFSLANTTPQAVTVTSNAATADISHGIQNFTNSSAATMAITLTTTSAVDGQFKEIRIYDFSAVAQTIGWTNTENSTVTVPTTSNGSTTLPLSVLFQFNSGTSKWRCLATS